MTIKPVHVEQTFKVYVDPSQKNGGCQYESIARNLKLSKYKRNVSTRRVINLLSKWVLNPKATSDSQIDLLWGANEGDYLREPDNVSYTYKRNRIVRDLRMNPVKYWGNEVTMTFLSKVYNVQFYIYCNKGQSGIQLYAKVGQGKRRIPLLFRNQHYDSLYVKFNNNNRKYYTLSETTLNRIE